jgi:predicted transglutaminase-like cysteine proteinase
MALAIVWHGRQWHMVNIVRTSKGDFVMDNLKTHLARLKDYKLIQVMDFNNPKLWFENH